MDELESQIAKIELGNTKDSNSYVFVLAEKAPVGNNELYVIAEMPLFNPAAEESCERICLAIASTLKRSYRNQNQENAFENAISQINEELGKLTSMGQTEWVNKLNCILGVKDGANFHIATCGKVSAYLLRNKEYTDISCSPTKTHPLKTFENFATGKIRLGDLIILSTTQMFNYLSMDRLLNIIGNASFLTATKTAIQMLKETAGPEVSFGVILNLQVPMGQTQEQEEDLENYIVEKPKSSINLLSGALSYVKTAFALGNEKTRTPKVDLPKISFGEKLQNIKGNTKSFLSQSGRVYEAAKTSAQSVRANVTTEKFKNLSPQKKFFLISAIVLLIAVAANITIAIRLKKTQATSSVITNQLKSAETLLQSASASLLYKDDAKAGDYFNQAKSKMPDAKNVDAGNKALYNKVLAEFSDTQAQMEKTYQTQVTNLGSLGQADSLIKLPNYVAVEVNKNIISYNKQNGKIEDSALKLPVNALDTAYISGNTAAVYDGTSLYVWDFSTGNLSAGFSQSVPGKNDIAGLAEYVTNSRVYAVDKKSGFIINFAAGKDGFAKPLVGIRDPQLSNAIDLTIDSSIYILTKTGALKFQSGRQAEFNLASLAIPFSGTGKIYTQKDFNFVYLLDAGNKRILILDKKGNLINSIKSETFTNLKDFQVDEKGKVMYVLNDGSLLKVSLP